MPRAKSASASRRTCSNENNVEGFGVQYIKNIMLCLGCFALLYLTLFNIKVKVDSTCHGD